MLTTLQPQRSIELLVLGEALHPRPALAAPPLARGVLDRVQSHAVADVPRKMPRRQACLATPYLDAIGHAAGTSLARVGGLLRVELRVRGRGAGLAVRRQRVQVRRAWDGVAAVARGRKRLVRGCVGAVRRGAHGWRSLVERGWWLLWLLPGRSML
jgi:hypothetical protein